MATTTSSPPEAGIRQPGNAALVGEPVWDLALLYPPQGAWTEAEYLEIGAKGLVEWNDGKLEFLPVPTFLHQFIVEFLHEAVKAFLKGKGIGRALQGPLRVRVGDRLIRLPDVVYFRPERIPADLRQLPNGADMAMEVVSEGQANADRDYVTKRADYAAAGIAEYWIVDPQLQRITVLTLDGNTYRVHGEFEAGQHATSVMFPALSVDVTAAFAAGEGQ